MTVKEWKTWPATRVGTEKVFIPSTFTDALNCPEAMKWEIAINDKYQSLMKKNTRSVVPCPSGKAPIKSHWIFDIKPAADGPSRNKTRFVAKGFS